MAERMEHVYTQVQLAGPAFLGVYTSLSTTACQACTACCTAWKALTVDDVDHSAPAAHRQVSFKDRSRAARGRQVHIRALEKTVVETQFEWAQQLDGAMELWQ